MYRLGIGKKTYKIHFYSSAIQPYFLAIFNLGDSLMKSVQKKHMYYSKKCVKKLSLSSRIFFY